MLNPSIFDFYHILTNFLSISFLPMNLFKKLLNKPIFLKYILSNNLSIFKN